MNILLFLILLAFVGVAEAAPVNRQIAQAPRNVWDEMRETFEAQRKFFEELDAKIKQDVRALEEQVKSNKAREVQIAEIKNPEITVEQKGDAVQIAIAGVTKDGVKVEYDEERDVVTVTFAYHHNHITMHVYPDYVTMLAERKVSEDVKNDKGEPVTHTSFVGHSSHTQMLSALVDPSKVSAEYKDNKLILILPRKETKHVVPVKSIPVK